MYPKPRPGLPAKTPEGERYELLDVYREDDTLRSSTLEGFDLDLGRIFETYSMKFSPMFSRKYPKTDDIPTYL